MDSKLIILVIGMEAVELRIHRRIDGIHYFLFNSQPSSLLPFRVQIIVPSAKITLHAENPR